jgi:hypothetical protein
MRSPLTWLREGHNYARTAHRALGRGDCLWAAVNVGAARAALRHASAAAPRLGPKDRAKLLDHLSEGAIRLRLVESVFGARCRVQSVAPPRPRPKKRRK